jgi:hypothetical protein
MEQKMIALEIDIEKEMKRALFTHERPCFGAREAVGEKCVNCEHRDACVIEFTGIKETLETVLTEKAAVAEVDLEHKELLELLASVDRRMTEEVAKVTEITIAPTEEVAVEKIEKADEIEKSDKGKKRAKAWQTGSLKSRGITLDMDALVAQIVATRTAKYGDVAKLVLTAIGDEGYKATAYSYATKILTGLAKSGAVDWKPKTKDIRWVI